MRRSAADTRKKYIIGAGAVITLFALWWLAAAAIGNALVLPTPPQTFAALPDVFKTQAFFKKVGATLLRTVIGFAASFVSGAVFAVLSLKKSVEDAMKPFISFMRSIPTLVLTVLLTSWFSKDLAPVIIGFMMVFPVTYGGLLAALKNTDKNLVEMARLYKVPGKSIIFTVYGKSALPYVFATASNSFGMNFKVVVSAEVLILPLLSIGREIFYGQVGYRVPEVFAWVIITLAVSFAVERLFDLAERLAVKWR